jgi:hypothetical protein
MADAPGLAGTSETDIVSGFCDRCVAARLPLARTLVLLKTAFTHALRHCPPQSPLAAASLS